MEIWVIKVNGKISNSNYRETLKYNKEVNKGS
jgi:hypothetical protein